MAKYLLHGTLHVTIYEADGLVNEDRKTGSAPLFFRKLVENIEEALSVGKGKSRLYGTVDLGEARVGRTRIIEHEPTRPVWNESFRIYAAHSVSDVTLSVKDDNPVGSTVLGRAKISVSEVLSGQPISDWHDLYKDNGTKVEGARVRFHLQFFDAKSDDHWGQGVMNPDYEGVPYTYFPMRKGCKVTLYQDSHMADNFLPPIYLEGNATREPTRCWEDVYNAIMGANHLIYITGWSVYTEIPLIRDQERMIEGAENVTLGELLKKKADEGVRVNLLVWDDRTSVGFLKRDGLMATHDEDTQKFFENTNVNCYLCPRNPDNSLSVIQGLQIGVMFTHHQKTIILDAPVPNADNGQRRILSFVGGIDLCDGRYDTQYHSLFRTLDGVHHNDFHQPNFAGACVEAGGPREPWHDIHSKVEGTIAWDVLFNFEQRWRKQAGGNKEKMLIPVKEVDAFDPPGPVTDEENDADTWNVQLFRSIDGGAVSFPENPEEASKAGLVSGKDNTIDRSIQDAYINAIRRAKDFIYIENQYFLGSSFAWDSHQDAEALHLIPIELTLKIVSKIEAGERFAVYIITPMWPEGVPESGSVQAILDWMHRTMEMMYKKIAEALHANQKYDESPRDYLNFYCLGNRESFQEGEYVPTKSPEGGTNYQLAQNNRRFMIYVHSKMMIVDDEYIIIGSANINERSMNGGRDSEIAMGAFQPYHLYGRRLPHGDIHGFRMGLWFEHMGKLDNLFLTPNSLECVRSVNEIADELWQYYMAEEPVDLAGHLLPFPVSVANDGTVTELPGQPHFPDTKAPVLGALQEAMPAILTT